ncbi:polysaccharide lyase family 8 super-sandwich domain-containing protein [Microbacterium sp. XT11]|uniref:polysaccharide lyase family 8 super-sandwich domain-containing protein n=2 Tax=Microbacterium sp. XT11 TaxID=367477 RepID=UPI00082CF49E|nr:polysaccharide lyase family 8 super-sandwich domain-containing protein [Microbacterium sp. XT11]
MFRISMKGALSASAVLMVTTALLLTPVDARADMPHSTSVVGPAAEVGVADAFDELREKYRTMLTGGTGYSLSDPDIAARVVQITDAAQGLWDTMQKAPDRVRLWNDASFGSDSASMTTTYSRLRDMALAYSTHGSDLEGDPALKADLISALDWMNANKFFDGVTMYQNWWHWQIGAPLALNDIVALLYDELTPTQVSDYMAAIAYTQPSVTMTGANRLWESQVIALSGINAKDSSRVAAGRDGLSALFPYVTSGDGFSTDGSFVQHSFYAYNGGYGVSLLAGISDLLYLLHGSAWEVVDPNKANVFRWIYEAYEPFIYKGNLMDMVRGREISRHGTQDLDAAVDVLEAMIRLFDVASPADSSAFKGMVKYWLQLDTDKTFHEQAPVDLIVAANGMLGDPSVTARGELTTHRQFSAMDRTVHLRPDFGFGISMSSSRIGNYEAINSENNKGWHTGDGMTYLYNDDLSQFNDDFWPTVDSYRLPGTTVLRNTTQAANARNGEDWVGGAGLRGEYGVAGMQLHPVGRSLEAKKSWFMFDDEIVALGTGISSTDGIATETIVENRKLNDAGDNVLTVNGAVEPTALGWSETLTGVDYAHLAGTVPGSDIGYYFPGGATLEGLREARTGNWRQVNSSAAWGDSTPHTRNYVTLAIGHGTNPTDESYSYVLLPNKTSAQVGAYAAAPDISILENSESVQAVRENSLNVTGINFWKDEPTKAGGVTSDRRASVMVSETADELELSVSDPTQKNVGMIYLTLDASATGLISKDPEVTVIQYRPTVVLKVDVNGTRGKALTAKFSLSGAETPNPAPIAIPDPYEAETLPVHSRTDSVSVYTDANASGGGKLGINNNAIGDYVEFSVDVTQPGTYAVSARALKASNNGTYQLSVDGTDAGAPRDMFWNTSETGKDFDLGSHTFATPGSHLFRLTTTGKNASASGYKLMLDYLRLIPADGGGGDPQPPTAPTDLESLAVSVSQIDLSWAASTSEDGVAGYRIYRDGSEVGSSTTTSFSDTGLAPSTTYTYTVRAYDHAARLSEASAAATATTAAVSTRLEAEALTASSGVIKSNADASGGQYRIFNAYGVAEQIDYAVPVSHAGAYDLVLGTMRFSDNGTYQLQIDGNDVGAPVDLFRPSGKVVVVDLGSVTLSAGVHEFTFTAVGKNTSSLGYKLPLDYIQLVSAIE